MSAEDKELSKECDKCIDEYLANKAIVDYGAIIEFNEIKYDTDLLTVPDDFITRMQYFGFEEWF